MIRYIKILLLLLMIPAMVHAQQAYSDSLKKALANAKTDSARYSTLGDLTYYYVQADPKTALNYVNERLMITRRNKDHELDESATLIMKGFILLVQEKYIESLAALEQALKIAQDPESSGKAWKRDGFPDPEKARIDIIANVHLSWGHLMGATNNIKAQIREYQLTKFLAQQSGDAGLVAWAEAQLAEDYLYTGKVDSALILVNLAKPVIEKNYMQLFGHVGIKKYIDIDDHLLALIYLQKKDTALAVHYFQQGVKDGIAQTDLSNLAACYSDFSEYYLGIKQPDSGLFYAKKALETLHRKGSDDVAEVYKDIYSAYKLKHARDSAYKYEDLAMAAQDSSYNASQESLSNFQKRSFNDQLHERDEEKERLAAQTRNRIYLLLAGIAVLVLLAAVFFRNYKKTQIANHLLNLQKEEIQAALAQLKSTQIQLIQREKMASLGELTAGIAHEIQNPLNFVNNFSEVNTELLDELEQEISKGDLEEIKAIAGDIKENQLKISQHGKRADSIVKGMLQHSRTSTGERQPTDINTLADEFFKLSYHGIRAKDKSFNADMQTQFDGHLPLINIARQDFGRVFLNLFNNAFYAVQQKQITAGESYKPLVEVSTIRIGDKVKISVKDNGTGIPENIRQKIMQPFFTTKPTGQGTGLGLSISYDIVNSQGGSLEIDSVDGEWTEFRVILPV